MKKLYRDAYPWTCKKFVKTGEFRKVRKGEYFLSGAIPEAWKYTSNVPTSDRFHILRPATEDEIMCPCCDQPRRAES